jgi:tripartite-type tricarboxylate transporter receptor subunit TctC
MACASAFAQSNYPTRAIRVVVPYTAGGNTDVITRGIMKELSRRLGQPIVVDNKPGANSILGTDQVAKAPADGYTLLVAIGALANNQALYKKLPYAATDLAPISLLTRTSLVLATGLPGIKNMEDLSRYASANGVTYASSGVGSTAHLLGERLAKTTQLKSPLHIPYKGSVDGMTDLVGGRVTYMFDAVSALGPQIKDGKLTALAVTGENRSPALPAVPTIKELGHGELVSYAWSALLGPANMPAPVLARLSSELSQVLSDPELKARLALISTETVGGTPAEAAAFIARETKVNGDVIRALNISLD